MSKIPVSQLINIDNPKEFKLHAARESDEDKPLDVYVRDKKEWFDWNRWRNHKNEFSRKYIFSLIDFYPERDMWLFGGIYEVVKRNKTPQSHSYEIKELTEYSDFIGRLKIKLKKPSRGRAFYLEHHLDKMTVSEILKQPYSGEVFPGYENINHSFDILTPIFKNENKDWKAALKNIKGIYVITDKSNGKKYIGKASGDSGIWSRWSCYIESGHGGNDELTKLIKEKGYDHAKKNFRLALLEYRSMKVDDEIIIERENYWKGVFLSKGKFGYNKN
ncbi:MAG: GIY-YIG nuclease family protein [candidate division Zixibacteria bacterium]|nr:GIY-YIG nuclease family protein [candidate division Zixibacteria bacterium]